MVKYFFLILLFILPSVAYAETPGLQGFKAIKQCIMQNDTGLCHASMTQSSYEIFDKFTAYKLMPCLPTDFKYESEHKSGTKTIVKAEMPQDNANKYIFHMVFVKQDEEVKLDLPETLRVGLGDNWQDKLNMSEQLFLMMRQNMQDELTCDVLINLVKPNNG